MVRLGYFFQAMFIVFWWLGMMFDEKFYLAFSYPGIEKNAHYSMLLPDMVMLGMCSLLRYFYSSKTIGFIILGAFTFATLYCINAYLLTSGGFLPTTIMILGLCYNLFLIFGPYLFRQSIHNSFTVNSLKTIVQICVVWGLTLVFMPWIIMVSFDVSVPVVYEGKLFIIIIFVIFLLLGLYSAFLLVKIGQGTPLPLDQPQKLVIEGPYKYIRNPMAVAGIGQGIALSIFFNSVHLLIYVVIGGVIWQWVVKPIEEENLKIRFGSAYIQYQKDVPCWLPRF